MISLLAALSGFTAVLAGYSLSIEAWGAALAWTVVAAGAAGWAVWEEGRP